MHDETNENKEIEPPGDNDAKRRQGKPEELPVETAEILALWGLKPGMWREVGQVASGLGAVSRPIVELDGYRYVIRRQPVDLTEEDTRFRHAFMRHLRACSLPVPEILARSDGRTYAIIGEGIYELQGWLGGSRYVSGHPGDIGLLEASAGTLGSLHQASGEFQWRPHRWGEERSPEAISSAYIELLRRRAVSGHLPSAVASGIERVAEGCSARLPDALASLEASPGPPELHIHGDYQAHNLAFSEARVAAIYDFDTVHWARRIDELAYSLLYFAGVRWDETPTVTPPLVDDGLDILRAHNFLHAYGFEAPPADGEALLLADALTLAFPVVFANGVAEDLVFPEDFEGEPEEQEALARLLWADTFWLWLDRYRETLKEAWESA
jgi:Ser/Thr protein kinase RdoA (MazF antagonist)